jgi:hypothetical protein
MQSAAVMVWSTANDSACCAASFLQVMGLWIIMGLSLGLSAVLTTTARLQAKLRSMRSR